MRDWRQGAWLVKAWPGQWPSAARDDTVRSLGALFLLGGGFVTLLGARIGGGIYHVLYSPTEARVWRLLIAGVALPFAVGAIDLYLRLRACEFSGEQKKELPSSGSIEVVDPSRTRKKEPP
jgi:hypothetical protein